MQITLGDVIGWIITIVSAVGVVVTVSVKLSINSRKVNQSKSDVRGDQIGGDKIGGDKHDK